ncbi:MAG: hypothetical protein AMXMBFR79_05450 [Chitinophagaceae bacterium]|nr:DUF4197 domain-containing protein [Chitinophagales bacterium]
MKKIIGILLLSFIVSVSNAQILKEVYKKVTGGGDKNSTNGLSTEEVVSGLKEALTLGAEKSASQLSNMDGFFKNAAIKILLPDEAKKVVETVSRVPGGQKLVDDAILSMNRAAEDAAKSAAPIFVNAIKNMSFADAWNILRGGDSAATKYLREQTTKPLTEAFKPVIEKSLEKVNATQHWNTVFSTYNKFSFKKINPDLSGYVTDKALEGIFYQLALEEQKIRKDPVAQTTNLLKKVFGVN